MPLPLRTLGTLLFVCIWFMDANLAVADDWHVAPGGRGAGGAADPFGSIQAALDAAGPGDTIHVRPGAYHESLRTVRDATVAQPITVRAAGARGGVAVTLAGRLLTVRHSHLTIDGLVFDGQYAASDLIRVETAGHGFTLRHSEVRRTSRDAIDVGGPSDVLIERSVIHHALNAADGRTDAHGIVAGAARRLTIRETEIHTFSGDAVQIDPGRASPGWDEVTIEGCRFWLGPLATETNGFAAGTVPGENAVDTKVGPSLPRPRIVIRNTEAFGFRDGLIRNMAAFNIKERVNAVIDGVTVHTSEIAFRLRAPAEVRVQNAVVHGVSAGVRYEGDIEGLKVWNSTFGANVARVFVRAGSRRSALEVRNVVVLAAELPSEASHPSNLAVAASAFVDAAHHRYELAAGSPAVDAGVTIGAVTEDRRGTARPQGRAYDAGAYERLPRGSGGRARQREAFTISRAAREERLERLQRQVGDTEELGAAGALPVKIRASGDGQSIVCRHLAIPPGRVGVVGAVEGLDRGQAGRHQFGHDLVLLRVPGMRERRRASRFAHEGHDVRR